MHVWNQAAETMPREKLEALQLERLRQTVQKVTDIVPFYQQKFKEAGLEPGDIQSLDDLAKIPFTTKAEMQANYPYNMFAVPMEEVVRLHASSGTTGQPTVVGYTRNDLESWSECIARLLTAGGVTKKDIVQVAFGYGLFTGGFGLHYGVEKIGATVVPVSSGNTARQMMIMKDFKTTALICTPSYAVYLGEVLAEKNIAPDELPLRVGCFGGEPWSNSMRKEIEARLGIMATDNYGLSEVMGPGVSYECEQQSGMHLSEDHFIVEVIDPATGETLPPGSTGELVITTLTKEAIPVLRYRTRDIACIVTEPCACGRTSYRMCKPHGRTDDMLIIRGVNIFPTQVETVLIEMDETDPHYQLVVTREAALDNLEIKVELNENYFSDEMRQLRAIEERIKARLKDALGVSAKITLVEPKTLERTAGKSKRVLDLREYLQE